jgi:hypothetical protein
MSMIIFHSKITYFFLLETPENKFGPWSSKNVGLNFLKTTKTPHVSFN